MPQAAERKLLELPNALPREVELLADLLECARDAVVEPIAQREDPPLANRKSIDRSYNFV